MTNRCILAVVLAFVMGLMFFSVVAKIYIDNLHYTACKMYNSVESNAQFNYVNTQFQCGK